MGAVNGYGINGETLAPEAPAASSIAAK